MIPQHLTGCLCIEAFICIEERTLVGETTAPHVRKKLLERLRYVICVVMVASPELACSDNVAISISQSEDVACLGLLPPLVGDTFAPFLAIV